VPQGLVDLITGGTRGVESAREYAQGVPPRADALNDALAMAGLAMTGGGLAASTLRPKKPSLPSAPKERGDMILSMLKEGDAANITDDMFDMGDSVKTTQLNQYLFENYDLPMDAESRAQRLFQMGYRREGMHGTSKETAGTTETPDILAFRPSTAGAYGRGVYVDPVRDGDIGVSRYYAEPRSREAGTSGTYYPLLTKGKLMERGSYDDIFQQAMEDLGESSAVTRDAADRLAEQRVSEQGFAGVGGAGEYTIFDPANIRSRSARADPRLAHLSNIMAANASKPTGLLTSSAADLRRQANIERFGYDPNETPEVSGFDAYLRRVNPSDKRIPAENRPNLMMGDMYGMLPRDAEYVSNIGSADIYRTPDGSYYATAYNPDLGEMDVVGYAIKGDKETDLQVVSEMQGKGIGGELQYLFRKENPDAPTGGLTEAGEASLLKTYNKLRDDGVVAANASKSTGLLTTAASEAQDMAKRILELRAEGRASEVTDEMMAQADPQYMFANTPLPMDEASRMARAEAAGFDVGNPVFHGGASGIKAMDADVSEGKDFDTGVWTTSDRYNANRYAGSRTEGAPKINDQQNWSIYDDRGSVYPLLAKTSGYGETNFRGRNWGDAPEGAIIRGGGQPSQRISEVREDWRAWPYTSEAVRAARDTGRSGLVIKDVVDIGPNFPHKDHIGLGSEISDDVVAIDPSTLRSRFARFDPEFAHLSNLSAANASPIGGLLAQSGVSDKQAERIEEYLRRRGLLD
jgi:hypothetical protein